MANLRFAVIALVLSAALCGGTFADVLADNLNDFLHYTKIGRLDLAKDYARAVIDSEPNSARILELLQENVHGHLLLEKAQQNKHDAELAELAGKVLEIIEQGRFDKRTDTQIIGQEIIRLSSTARGRLAAVKRLANAGEYAIPFMLDVLADGTRRDETPNIVWALPQIGKDAIRPLVAALQTPDMAVRAEIVKALGGIGYPQSLAYLKYVIENDESAELRDLAAKSIQQIEPASLTLPSAELFYRLAEDYYYHRGSLTPAEDADFANMWFWDSAARGLIKHKVGKEYFYELMAMRSCEWALRADPATGKAIGLWLAAFFKAESADVAMPEFFGPGHAPANVYATTAGAEYLHQALARAIRDKNAYVALQCVEALAVNAGEKSLMYRLAMEQPLLDALSFDDKAVQYSAAIAVGLAGPQQDFAEKRIVVQSLAAALGETEGDLANKYPLRAVTTMLKLATERNPVIDLAGGEGALIEATHSEQSQIKLPAIKTLAYLRSATAQKAIATVALKDAEDMQMRIEAFASLADSAKVNGNLLDEDRIDAIYSLVSATDIESELRSAAAGAYGALNLPSQKVKDLILDQAKK